jgi:hypothetical protein
MTRIFIEGYELDLTQGLSNQITYAIDDLQNIDSKSTSFTKTIVLPGTANNNKLLGNIFDFNNANFDNPLDPNVLANFNAARNASARIEIDGLQIMKGVLRLLEIIHVDGHIEYECALFGELGGFINALGNKRLEDLDFSAYDHTYSYANIVASWDTSGSTGYCYPLIDYGNVSTDKINFQYKTFKPALFVREYLDKIFTDSGYTYECDLFNTSDFRKLILPNNSKQLTKQTSEVLRLSTDVGQFLNESTSTDFVSYENKSGSLFTAASGDTAFIYNGTNPLTTTLSIEILGEYSLARGAFSLSVTKNGVAISGSNQIYDDTDSLYYNKTLSVSLVTNDVIRVRSTGSLEAGDFIDVTTSFLNVINNVATTSNVELGDAMVINDTIPKGIFQKDFITSIMKMYNLLIIEDKYKTNHLIIKPYIDFFNGRIVDWSDKLDHSKAIKIKPMSEINARYYNFKYKQDNDFYNEDYRKKFNEGYGDRVYDNGLEFAKDTESVELIFASSPLFGTSGTDKVFPAIYKKSDNNSKEDPMDHILRIMQINKISSITSWSILNGATNLGSNTAYLFAGHLNNPTTPTIDINFGAPQQLFFNLTSGDLSYNLFNVYYSPYMAEVTDKDSRLLTGFFDLTEIDIFNIDFAKYYFIDGGLYRLIKVYDYSPENNDTTKVDLLRVIENTAIDQGPTDIILSNNSINENRPIGTLVGLLSVDTDYPEDIITYSMVSGSTFFNIVNSSLFSSQVFNYETTNSYNITIRATNNFGKFIDKEFTINILDVAEPPIVVNEAINMLANISIAGNLLTNDSDPSGGTLTITQFIVQGVVWIPTSIVDIPDVGTLVVNANGNFTFTPNTNYYGIVPFIQYTVTSSASGLSTNGNLTIVVSATMNINILNNSTSANITNIRIDGINLTGITYPIIPSSSISTTRPRFSATGSVEIQYMNITSNFVKVTATNGSVFCTGATGTSYTFSGISLDPFGTLNIELGNGGCV